MARQLHFVTGNAGKLAEFKAIIGDTLPIVMVDLDVEELQGTPEEVSTAKVKAGAALVGGPVICEDVSLCFNALHGLPGPYIKWFFKGIGNQGLYNLLAAYEDKSAYALCVFAYCEGPGAEAKLFMGRNDGTIVAPRGPEPSFGWDPVFQPLGSSKTYAEMTKEEKNENSHRSRALAEIKPFLQGLYRQ